MLVLDDVTRRRRCWIVLVVMASGGVARADGLRADPESYSATSPDGRFVADVTVLKLRRHEPIDLWHSRTEGQEVSRRVADTGRGGVQQTTRVTLNPDGTARAIELDVTPAPKSLLQVRRTSAGAGDAPVWQVGLPWIPHQIAVSNHGQVATFDEWYRVGLGDRVIVLFDAQGTKQRSLRLEDFLGPVQRRRVTHSVSSVWWAGMGAYQHQFTPDGKELVLRVFLDVPMPMYEQPDPVEVRLEVATGEVL